jgi:hypothetical protein
VVRLVGMTCVVVGWYVGCCWCVFGVLCSLLGCVCRVVNGLLC